MEAIGMKVSWMVGYGNLPSLHVLLDEPPVKEGPWRLFPVNGGNFLVRRNEPAVRFVFESSRGGGAMGGAFVLEDGTEHRSNGGWSSNVGQVNRLRALDERFAEYLPFDLVDVTVYGEYARPDTYNDGWGMGMFGVDFERPWIEAAMSRLLPGIELLDANNRKPDGKVEVEASAEQAAIFGGGASASGFIPVPVGWDGTKEGIKPPLDSELFLRTAMETDRKRAEQIRQREAIKEEV